MGHLLRCSPPLYRCDYAVSVLLYYVCYGCVPAVGVLLRGCSPAADVLLTGLWLSLLLLVFLCCMQVCFSSEFAPALFALQLCSWCACPAWLFSCSRCAPDQVVLISPIYDVPLLYICRCAECAPALSVFLDLAFSSFNVTDFMYLFFSVGTALDMQLR